MLEPKKLTVEEKRELIKKIRSYYTGENRFYGTRLTAEERELTEEQSEKIKNNILFAAFADDIVETKEMIKEIREMVADKSFCRGRRRRKSRKVQLKDYSIPDKNSWAELILK